MWVRILVSRAKNLHRESAGAQVLLDLSLNEGRKHLLQTLSWIGMAAFVAKNPDRVCPFCECRGARSRTSGCSSTTQLTMSSEGGSSRLSKRRKSPIMSGNPIAILSVHGWRCPGPPFKGIQELIGHKTIQMSARYAHLSPTHKLAAVERIAKPVAATTPPATVGANSNQNSHQRRNIRAKGEKKADLNVK